MYRVAIEIAIRNGAPSGRVTRVFQNLELSPDDAAALTTTLGAVLAGFGFVLVNEEEA